MESKRNSIKSPTDSLFEGGTVSPFYENLENAVEFEDGRERSKSRLSIDDFLNESFNKDSNPFIDKAPEIILYDINTNNLLDFSKDDNVFNTYMNCKMDINSLWNLLKGNKIKQMKIHKTREFIDQLPFHLNLDKKKHQLDKSIHNASRYTPCPEKFFQNLKDYHRWIKELCEQNCHVVPIHLNSGQVIFLPKISPFWFLNIDKFDSIENYGYLNPNSESCISWLPIWINQYITKIKKLYLSCNTLFLEENSFLSKSEEPLFKTHLLKSINSLIEQDNFQIKIKTDTTFKENHIIYLKKVIRLNKKINKLDLTIHENLKEISILYSEIIKYEIIY